MEDGEAVARAPRSTRAKAGRGCDVPLGVILRQIQEVVSRSLKLNSSAVARIGTLALAMEKAEPKPRRRST
ncbi:hypothetical protein CO666_25510 [Rhizobium chutanense]|uniref:Uncharacterized protein n=1 Tax=Rhizobium chutanense TaxID=2035448 RepID=A0A2A6J6F8_9HYPH|nr:hypothetical protein CO666_25510 [Rhizobium chutanense]